MRLHGSRVMFGWALAAAVVLAAPVAAQEWTRFRGPNGSGISTATTVPVTVTPSDYNWRVALPGTGHSSPVVWGKKLFVTSAQPEAGKRHVVCLDTATGRALWTRSYDYTPYATHQFNNAASSTPAVDAEHVYVIWPAPAAFVVHALDHSGKEVWKRDLGGYEAQHGGASSPIVVGDTVIVAKEPEGRDGLLAGLDRKTGALRWKRDRFSKDAPYATPLVYQPESGKPEVIFTSTSHGFTSLDPATGELNWEVRDVFKARCVASPVLAKGLVFATAGTGGGAREALAIRPGSKAAKTAGKLEYRMPRGPSYVPTPIMVGDLLFLWGDAGIVTCVRPETGETVWSERTVTSNFFGSPVAVNGKLYAMSSKGELVVVAAAPEFKLLGRSELGEASHATPAVAGGVMYLRTEGHVISVGGRK